MQRIIQVQMEDKPGALMRVAGIVTATGSNIVALTVAPDPSQPGLARMAILADLELHLHHRVIAKMNRLVEVLSAIDITCDYRGAKPATRHSASDWHDLESAMATGGRKDPNRGFNFKLVIDGKQQAGFQECVGLDSASDGSEERVENETLSSAGKLPSPNQYSSITLKWGITNDHSLWEWHSKIAATAQTERKNGSIVLTDDAGQEKERWNFVNAWPTKWTGPSFNATANEVSIETLEISHQGVTKV